MEDDALHAGAILRQKRIAAGLSIADVSRLSGIRATVIEAIEAGSFDAMPAVYMRSFVRRYARAIGVDERELPPIEGEPHRQSRRAIHSQPPPTTESPSSRRTIVAIAALLVAAVAGYLMLSPSDSPTRTPTSDSSQTPVETLRTTPSGGGLLDYFGATSGDSIRLEAIATDTAWMSVTMDGRRSEQVTLRPGDRRQWTANEAIVVSIGNVGGVELYRNGTKLPSLGARGEAVRYVKITATDVIPSTSSWARKRDSVLETLRSRPPQTVSNSTMSQSPRQPSSATATSPQQRQTVQPRSAISSDERRRQEILRRAAQQRQITPVPPKVPLPTPTKQSSP